jgi:hypothetical protein
MSYTNLNNPANYQLQSFGQDGMRTISTTQAYIQGEYYRVIVATEDSTLSATSMVGDDLVNIDVFAGTTIYGLFTAITVTAGEVTAYLAGRTDIDDVWAYIRAYGVAGGATIEGEDCAKAAISPLLDKYYAQASLVMVPSMYKTSVVYSERPLSSDGELTFTRASNATRVGPDGLIEKVRTNLLLQSNQFDTTWSIGANTTVTAGYSDPFGGSNAWRLTMTSGAGTILSQPITFSNVPYTFSVWAKANGNTNIALQIDASAETAFVLTNEWQRISFTYTATSGASIVQIGNSGGEVDALIYAAQLETGDIATDYIPTTSAAVSVGPVSNLPRLNYDPANPTCPSLLLEPSRTNLALYSEQLDNAAWTSTGVTVTANNTISPDGYQNADKVTNATTSDFISQIIAGPTATAYAASFYIKNEDSSVTEILVRNSVSGLFGEINWNGSQLVSITGVVNGTLTFESVGNDWYRIFAYFTSVETVQRVRVRPDNTVGGKSIYLWGYQLEQGASYSTSYIPTLGASVTRVADAAYKTGISSLIGQTEGTLFADFVPSVEFQHRFSIAAAGSSNNWIFFAMPEAASGNGRVYIRTNSITWLDTSTGLTGAFVNGQRYKVAFAYKSGDWAIYINGVLKSSGSQTFTTPSTMDGFYPTGTGPSSGVQVQLTETKFNQTLLFKTRLTNAALAELTTL